MGCGSSANTAVHPLRPEEVKGDEDETGSKVDSRGDSAFSKGTTDSGVVMENGDIPVLPGAVPRKLPPVASEWVRESDAGRTTQDGLLQQESILQERPKSSEILEELLNQGIIPVGETKERGTRAGEAYSIMLDNREGVRRRPPARLESLKAKKAQSLPSQEEIEEKIRLAEERRKLREDELKTRLRAMSARVRGPAPTSSSEDDKDVALTPVEPLSHQRWSARLEVTAEKKWVEQTRGSREKGGERGDNRGEGAEWVSEDGDGKEEEEEEEQLTQVEELKEDQLLTASVELESNSSFHHAEDKEEIF